MIEPEEASAEDLCARLECDWFVTVRQIADGLSATAKRTDDVVATAFRRCTHKEWHLIQSIKKTAPPDLWATLGSDDAIRATLRRGAWPELMRFVRHARGDRGRPRARA